MEATESSQKKQEPVSCHTSELLNLIGKSKTFLKDNVRLIESVYLNTLTEHCTGRKLSSKGKSKDAESSKDKEKPEKEKIENPEKFLENAIARWSFWKEKDQSSGNMRSVVRISFAELAALNRLSTLVELLKTLTTMMDRLIKGINITSSSLNSSREETKGVISYATVLLKTSCSLAEVFQLPSVSLDPSIEKYVGNEPSYMAKQCATFSTDNPVTYVPRLEVQINYLRAIVYTLGSYMISIIQTCILVVKPEMLEVNVREVMEVLTKLPPMYLRTKKLSHLTTATAEILQTAPPNKRVYSLAPKPNNQSQNITAGSDYERKKETKAFQRKYGKIRSIRIAP